MTEEELLEEAKRRYPVGTKFYAAHVCKDADSLYTVAGNYHLYEGNVRVDVEEPCARWLQLLCNVSSNRNNWAEIVESPASSPTIQLYPLI
jgi:hypothetical protein